MRMMISNEANERMESGMTQKSDPCFICKKHRGEVQGEIGPLWEDEHLYVFHAPFLGKEKVYSGHLMIETKRHLPGWGDLTDAEARAVGLWINRLAAALKAEGAEHIYSFVVGHHVPHLHVHVVPRYPGTPREYWGVRVDEWPQAPRGGLREIEELVGRLRKWLKADH